MLTSVRSPDVESVKARLKIIRANWFTKRGALIVIRSRVRHSSSWGSSAVHVSELSYLRGKGIKADTKRHPLLARITVKAITRDGIVCDAGLTVEQFRELP